MRRAVLVPLVLVLACSPEPAPPGPPPNVVLVVLDTLRADHLSCYGYERVTSPHLDDLCKSATVYENAHAASSWTLPSHASLFTGLLPIRHGAHHENRVLADRHETLAEALTEAGYQAIALVSNAMLSTDRRLDQGFDRYSETWRSRFDRHPKLFPNFESKRRMPWEDTEDPLFRAGMKQLRPGVDENTYFLFQQTVLKRRAAKPLFLFVNLIGVHSPYNSSGPFYEHFVRDPSLTLDENRWVEHYAGRVDFSQAQLDHFIDLYDAEILHVDHIVSLMIADLKAAGLWKNMIFIVTSDHGENLGEHGDLSHVFSLNETVTHVPLIIHGPPTFAEGLRIRTPVHLIDVFPTILAAAGIDPSTRDVDGVMLPMREESTKRDIVSEYYYPWENVRFMKKVFGGHVPALDALARRLRSVTRGNMKLIWGSDGRHQLYDLSRDPDELDNLIDNAEHAQTREALLSYLERFVDENGGDKPIPRWDPDDPERAPAEGPAGELDPETVRQLEELGYL